MDVRKQREETDSLLRDQIGFTSKAIRPDTPVLNLSGGEKQGVAIGRALHFDADLIILDEPTMGLSLSETQRVLDFVRGIRERGKSAIFISHNIYSVYPVADRFVILDRGQVAGQFEKENITQDELVERMVELTVSGKVSEQAE
jgi:simple sugar transport system ATP-binding protein